MPIRTLFRFLLGNRQAIRAVATDPRALWIGLLFVLSAALAREYDGADLQQEPEQLLLPYAASVAGSFLLFFLIRGIASPETSPLPALARSYWPWLRCFWMTAPLAWLYAIPFERFLTPLDATRANLGILAVVAVWRVLLIARATAVITGYRASDAFYLVMAMATGVAAMLFLFAMLSEVPAAMAGIRHHTQRETLVRQTAEHLGCVVCVLFPVFLVLAISPRRLEDADRQSRASEDPPPSRPGRGLLVFALLSVAVWIPVLPLTQPEQQLRFKVERAIQEGRFREAVAEIAVHAREDFPPGWELSSRWYERSGEGTSVLAMMEAVLEVPESARTFGWLRGMVLEHFELSLERWRWHYNPEKHGVRLARMLVRLPEGAALARKYDDVFEGVCWVSDLPADLRETLRPWHEQHSNKSP
jgi:uncharacterized membrane protein YhaH (DUF805 family)